MTTKSLPVHELARTITGEVVTPGDPSYDEARGVWNGLFIRRPTAVVRCTSAEDVAATMRFVKETDVPFVVRGGGHSISGLSSIDDGVVIDLSCMKKVEIDVRNRTARAQPGLLGADLDAATQQHGLATTLGTVSHTGIAGLTLGGGMGYLMRKHGLAADNLLSLEVVLADGTIARVDTGNHPDLFWALRGGGGQFAVVTEFEYRLHPVGPMVTVSLTGFATDDPLPGLRAARDIARHSSRERDMLLGFGQVKNVPGVPAELVGEAAFMVMGFSCAPADADLAWMRPLKEHTALFSVEAQLPYTAVQKQFDDDNPHGVLSYSKGLFLRELSDEALKTFVDALADAPVETTSLFVYLQQMGGRVSEVGIAGSPVSGRDADYVLNVTTRWTDPAVHETARTWSRRFIAKMRPHGMVQPPLNFEGDAASAISSGKGSGLYRGDVVERLASVKAVYDPEDRFRTLRHS